jgi:hypothetical protein
MDVKKIILSKDLMVVAANKSLFSPLNRWIIPVFVLVLNVVWKCHNTLCFSMFVFHLSYLMQNVFPVNKEKWWIGHNLLNEI